MKLQVFTTRIEDRDRDGVLGRPHCWLSDRITCVMKAPRKHLFSLMSDFGLHPDEEEFHYDLPGRVIVGDNLWLASEELRRISRRSTAITRRLTQLGRDAPDAFTVLQDGSGPKRKKGKKTVLADIFRIKPNAK
jgi:hypothetical protein